MDASSLTLHPWVAFLRATGDVCRKEADAEGDRVTRNGQYDTRPKLKINSQA